jgi:glycyl-tRNA synthetase beta chain
VTVLEVETRNSKIENGDSTVDQSQSAIDSRPSKITLPLLLEVGCEEIPARFLRDAEKGLGERVRAALAEARLLPRADEIPDKIPLCESPLKTYSTPRRLVVYVPALLKQQPDKVQEILGPPVKVAINAEGNYTRAAESFAQKNSARVEELTRTTTSKGEYLSLRKTTQGRSAREILPEILPGAILGLAFPKSMYWTEKSAPRFVRPIRWILALLGEGKQAATVDFQILGVKSGDFTFGHRAKSLDPLRIRSFKDYAKKLAQAHVEIDPVSRRERIVQESQAVLENYSLRIIGDEWLVDWIVNSTEWPRPILGSFHERFLHLPREILVTVMRDHQKYFAVEDGQGNLCPYFVAALNMDSDEKGLIRQGHQRVLTARFRDAEFFWDTDLKVPLERRMNILEQVTYQAELGSYGDKVRRMRAIASRLCAKLESERKFREVDTVCAMQAIDLCKCDLTTQMVQEFPELQGIVGGLYANEQNFPKDVYEAIYDHYLPLGAEGKSPRSIVGASVSIADKLDSVVAGFAIGREPTGSSDPFALRRQANGAIKVILENSLPLSLNEMVTYCIKALETQFGKSASEAKPGSRSPLLRADYKWRKPPEEVRARVLDFFAERLRYYFESVRGFRYDTVRAVVAAGADQPADAQARAEAMEALRGGEDFEALSAAAKRIRNILAKSATAEDWDPGEVVPELLTEPQERDLYEAYGRISGEVERRRAGREYRRALEEISTLRPLVDRFFDKVLVMAEDRELRQNRLRLLKKLDELFSGIAHFAEIEGQ